MTTTEQVMRRMGFPETESGPYVTQLRQLVAKQVSEGMATRSAGTWADECYERDGHGFIIGWKISHEERARAFLEVEWELQRGHSHRVECVDCFPVNRHFSINEMRWHYSFRPDRIAPWLRDKFRIIGFHWRVNRDRLLGRQNPFAKR